MFQQHLYIPFTNVLLTVQKPITEKYYVNKTYTCLQNYESSCRVYVYVWVYIYYMCVCVCV